MNSEIAVLYFFAHILGKETKKNEALKVVEEMFISRQKYYSREGVYGFGFEYLEPPLQQKALSLKQRIYDKKGPIKGYMDVYLNKDEDIKKIFTFYSYLFDSEKLTASLLQTVNYRDIDINDITASYFSIFKNQNIDEALKYLIGGIIVKGLLKAYKEVKEYYFANNKETMYIEMKNQEDKIQELEFQNTALVKQNQVLKKQVEEQRDKISAEFQEQIYNLQKEIQELKEQIKELKENESELFALREFIFGLGQEEQIEEQGEIQPIYIKGIIIGGREKWQQRMKEILPNFTFITIGNENFDTNIFNNAEIALFNTSYLNHKIYYKSINEIRKRGLPLGYITNNIRNVLDTIKALV